MSRNFHLNLIRSAANDLLLQIESYSEQLRSVPNERNRKQLVEVIRYLAERMRDLLLLVENEEPE